MKIAKCAAVLLIAPLFMVGCDKGPSDSEVKNLIEDQYDMAKSAMDDAMSSAGTGNDEMAKAMGNMMAGMVPTLEEVNDVNCDSIEGDNTYMCTAEVVQTINGKTRTDKGSFKVYKVNDEWVLGQ